MAHLSQAQDPGPWNSIIPTPTQLEVWGLLAKMRK